MRSLKNPKNMVIMERNELYLMFVFPVDSAILITCVNILTNHIDPLEQYDWQKFLSRFSTNENELQNQNNGQK